MIEVKFLDACENCPRLEVTQVTKCLAISDGREIYQHTITCANTGICKNLINYLNKEENKNGN